MMAPLGHRQRSVEMDLLLFDPLRFLDHESGRAGGMGVELAAVDRYVNLRSGEAGDELGLLQTEQICGHAPRDVNRMADRVGAESDAAGGAEFGERIRTHFPFGVEHIGVAAVGGAQVNKLIEIVGAARQSQDRPDHQSRANGADGQSIGFGRAVYDVGSFSSRRALDKFNDDMRVCREYTFRETSPAPWSETRPSRRVRRRGRP